MSKIKVKLIAEEVIDNIYDTIIEDNVIKYEEGNVNVTITKNKDYVKMERKCSDYLITLNLKKGKNISYYQVFGGSKVFELETIVNKYKVNNKVIEIDYNLEGNDFYFKLENIYL